MAVELPRTLTPFRRRLLTEVRADRSVLASTPSFAFVWPTAHCSIGCAHCNFSSVPLAQGKREARSITPATLVQWLVQAQARHLVLCGGGEPLDAPEFCAETIRLCSETDMNFGIYTSGASLREPRTPLEYISEWKRHRSGTHVGSFSVRLSVDAFHVDRLGADVVAEWVRLLATEAPEWRLSLRGLRVDGDDSLHRVAEAVGGTIRSYGQRGLRLALPSGRTVAIERMAYIIDGRASLRVLERRGLQLSAESSATLAPWVAVARRGRQLGRPLSRRLTVGRTRVDLEIHPDASVHVLESQATDLRLSYLDHSWPEIRDVYYRDPVIHAVAHGGLAQVAVLIGEAIQLGIAPPETVPFSVEHLSQHRALDWVTAQIVTRGLSGVVYPDGARGVAHSDGEMSRAAGGRAIVSPRIPKGRSDH